MSDIAKRPNRTPRRVREKRALQLLSVGAVAGLVTVVGFLLAVIGIGSFGIPVLAAIIAAICFVLFRRTTS
jgi:putative flippase GtrA